MYAECPHCHAIFRVTQAILQRANGKVRCGECGTIFQALTRNEADTAKPITQPPIIDSKPLGKPLNPAAERVAAQPPAAPPATPSAAQTPRPDARPRDLREPAPAAPQPSLHSPDIALPKQPGEPVFTRIQLPIPLQQPDFGRAAAAPRRGTAMRTWFGSLAAVALILLLVGQYLRAHRFALADYPELRPMLFVVCRLSACDVPARRDLSKLELLSHGVFSHPTTEGALMIKASFANRAAFDQPYPVVQVSLANLQGLVVAQRRFSPDEYLDAQQSTSTTLSPGQTAQLSLEVSDPGRSALAFEFEFL